MSTQGALTSSPSSSSTPQWTYDIFLSFRGEDIRKNFIDHLYDALVRKGILTFKDDETLERGNIISKELLKAIEKSRFAIVIFSKNYASSKWCLDELVHIVRCMKETGLRVMPVFYHVNPSDVRKQRGTFAQAFKEHEKCFGKSFLERLNKCKSKKMKKWRFALREVANKCKSKNMKKWRFALREVANISGWDLQDRSEAGFIRQIVREIEKLSSKISSTTKNLVGIESSVQKLISLYLGFENDVGMIGIYGMGGLGKTTLARLVYDNFHNHFHGSSFIAKVREGSKNGCLHLLQQQLLKDILEDKKIVINDVFDGVDKISKYLCSKKVLLVIDDVDQLDQLKNLAGELNWFGKGSCIIITTRDERVLIQHRVRERYKSNELDSDDALKLFCLNAFKNEQPKEDYMKLSEDVVKYANGLPLAIVTLGSFFVGRTIKEWQCALDGFKTTERKIFDVLKISYDGLYAQDLKDMFLDIACFFNGKEKDQVIVILENCGFNARYGISVLVEKSLITVDDEEHLRMHDLLQEMGEQIIRQQSSEYLGKQSRLCLSKDLFHVLKENMATEAIQAISFYFRGREKDINLEDFSEGFSKMSNLRLLVISGIDFSSDKRHLALPNNLRYLRWRGCPFKCLASSDEQQMKFVYLDLQCSNFKYLWKGVMHSGNLKFIDLSCSQNLIRTPDFSGVPMLEVLDLFSCSRLVEIDPSIGKLQKLRRLNLYWCASLTSLPSMSEMMHSLTILNLSRCYNISSFPKFTGIMKSLSELDLSWTAIKEVKPSSIKYLTALTFLDLSDCTSLECLPSNMDTLKSLETLKFSQCPKLKSLPRFPSNVRYLETGGFFSLNWSPEGVKLSIWSHPLSQWLPFDESGSLEGFTVLLHVLRGLLFRKAVLGGYIIWACSAVKKGSSINIKLPSNWKKSEWIGFALWASLQPDGEEVRAHVIATGDMLWNHCDYMLWNHHASVHSTTYIDGICLLYLSREDRIATVGDGECSQIEVKFSNSRCSALHILGACGVSLIYKQDEVRVDELNETNAPYFIESTGEVSIYKLTAGDEDVRTVGEVVHKFRYDDFDDTDI